MGEINGSAPVLDKIETKKSMNLNFDYIVVVVAMTARTTNFLRRIFLHWMNFED